MIPTERVLSRRKLLAGAAVTAALTPFIPILESEAQQGKKQRFMTLMGNANGVWQQEWTPTGTVNDFQFKRILTPLNDWKHKLVVVAGTSFNRSPPGSNHLLGNVQMFSGSGLNEGSEGGRGNGGSVGWGSHISVDQAWAKSVAGQTPFDSMVMTCQFRTDVRGRQSYLADNQPIVPETQPRDLFDKVFGGAVLKTPNDMTQLRAEKRSVLDVVQNQMRSLQPRYGVRDKRKIEAHLDSLRAIENRLEGPQIQCDGVKRPPDLGPPGATGDRKTMPGRIEAFTDLTVAMLACDLTRTISMQWTPPTDQTIYTWLGHTDKHHEISHDRSRSEELIEIDIWLTERFRELLEKMDAVSEGAGSLLDHTLILSGNELGDGAGHSGDDIPVILAGGVDRIQMGRFLQAGGQLNNRTLVTVLHALGVDETLETFGKADVGSGTLKGLLTS